MKIEECVTKIKDCILYYFIGKKIKISVGGISKSGKTSFCKAFTDKKVLKKERTTLGIHTRPFIKDGVRGSISDIGGASEYTNIMDYMYRNSDAHIFFVDASVPSELSNAKHMFEGLLKRNHRISIPILIMCTHNDVKGFMSCQDIALEMGLDRFIGRDIACYSTSSLTRSNFTAVEEWIIKRAK